MFGLVRKKTIDKMIEEEIENFQEFSLRPYSKESDPYYEGAIWGLRHFRRWKLRVVS